jgi:hypothetical protein
MNFVEEDRTPEVLLNEIIWRSVKGANSPMPPPRRSAFVRPLPRQRSDTLRGRVASGIWDLGIW